MKKVLITGITGFVGSHLADFLLEKNYEVYGTERHRSKTENIEHIKNKITIMNADTRDLSSMIRIIDKIKPDYVFHLAAQSYVPQSWDAPQETLINNIVGNANLFEAVKNANIDPVIHVAGSSEEYGLVYQNEIPIKETNPLRPLSPYGVSKVAQDLLGWQYFKSYNMKIIRTRAFNHSGPRRGDVFVCSNFAKQIAQIEKELQEPVILHGNLDAKRDFSDVRDVVKAYESAVLKCEPGEVYNLCSEKEGLYSIKKILEILISMAGVKIKTKQDSARMRPSDINILYGDSSKFRDKTGWTPKISFRKTLEDLLNYWREKLK